VEIVDANCPGYSQGFYTALRELHPDVFERIYTQNREVE
jgi:hypothetical protein